MCFLDYLCVCLSMCLCLPACLPVCLATIVVEFYCHPALVLGYFTGIKITTWSKVACITHNITGLTSNQSAPPVFNFNLPFFPGRGTHTINYLINGLHNRHGSNGGGFLPEETAMAAPHRTWGLLIGSPLL